MKKIILFCFIISTIAMAKSIPFIHYDPFKKAKILLKRTTPKKRYFRQSSLKVTAIFNKKAYINGKFYGVNSIVNGYKIIRIQEHYIQVQKHRKISTIPLIKSNFLHSISIEGPR